MWGFVFIIFLAVFFQTGAWLSIFRRRVRLPLVIAAAIAAYIPYSAAANVNIKLFTVVMNDMQTLVAGCTIAMGQSLIALLLMTGLQKRRSEEVKIPLYMYLAWVPPVLFPVVVASGMIFLFNTATGWNFGMLGLAYVAAVFGILGVLAEIFAWRYPLRESREGIVASVYLLTIVAAMFLPQIVSGEINADYATADYHAALFIIPCMIIIVFAAIAADLYRHSRKLNKYWSSKNEFYG